jgi:hypothetical protein
MNDLWPKLSGLELDWLVGQSKKAPIKTFIFPFILGEKRWQLCSHIF